MKTSMLKKETVKRLSNAVNVYSQMQIKKQRFMPGKGTEVLWTK